MKNKIIGIFLMTLLITTSIQVIGTQNKTIETKDITPLPGFPPLPPTAPLGPTFAHKGQSCFYQVVSNSLFPLIPIIIQVDWDDGSKTYSPFGYQPVGFIHIIEHHWNNPGTYFIKARGLALNPIGPDWEGPWSPTWKVDIIDLTTNDPPNKPNKPSGPYNNWYGTYTYSTSATDPDGDKIAYQFNFDDGSPLEWTSYYNSGQTASVTHKWENPGIYDIRVKAKDEKGEESGWSDVLTVWMYTAVPMWNHPPNTPNQPKPTDASDVVVGDTFTYYTSATDPDGNQVSYRFDFNDIDYTGPIVPTIFWSSYKISGQSYSQNHKWTKPGFWAVKAKAKDTFGTTSDWSLPYFVIVADNKQPNKPILTGSDIGKLGTPIVFSASASDPEGDKVRYGWDTDNDFTVDQWSNYYNTGQTDAKSFTYSDLGQHIIRVKAEDEHTLEGDWSDPHIVTINRFGIKSKQYTNQPIMNLFENHPTIYVIIEKLIGLL
jgi:hypothetical protein